MHPFLIIRAGNTLAKARDMFGEFETFFIKCFSEKPEDCIILSAQVQPSYPDLEKISGIIVTGASEYVTDKTAWMMHLQDLIVKAHNISTPLLGICFGHQIIGEALGGKVDYYANGEFGIIEVNKHSEEPVLGNKLPSKFYAYASHSQSIITLPHGAISLASSNNEPNHIVYFGNKTWGMQFHPEFTHKIMKVYLQASKQYGELGSMNEKTSAENTGRFILDSFLNYCG